MLPKLSRITNTMFVTWFDDIFDNYGNSWLKQKQIWSDLCNICAFIAYFRYIFNWHHIRMYTDLVRSMMLFIYSNGSHCGAPNRWNALFSFIFVHFRLFVADFVFHTVTWWVLYINSLVSYEFILFYASTQCPLDTLRAQWNPPNGRREEQGEKERNMSEQQQ